MPDVEPRFMPSKAQRAEWKRHIIWADKTADGWWLGWCPRHDEKRDPDKATAEYNFMTGKFRCTGELSCHEGRTVIPLSTAVAWREGYTDRAEMRAAKRGSNAAAREERRSERRASRSQRYTEAAERLGLIRDRFPDLSPELLPTKPQVANWESWVDFSSEPLVIGGMGGWWLGWCPLHDIEGPSLTAAHSAQFNFRYGSYKCLRPEPCHAPKKGMTLVNLARAMETASAK